MSPLLVILIILTVVFLTGIIYGVLAKKECVFVPSFVFIIFTGVFGWGLVGDTFIVKYKETPVEARVVVDIESIYVVVGKDVVKTVKDVSTYNRLKEKKTVYLVKKESINVYGIPIESEWIIPDIETPQ